MNTQKKSAAYKAFGVPLLFISVIAVLLFGACKESINYDIGFIAQASAQGYNGPITVEVLVAKGKIKTAKLIAYMDSPNRKHYVEQLIIQAVKNGGTAGLDTVSGATKSTKAVIKALEEAVKKAKTQEAQSGT